MDILPLLVQMLLFQHQIDINWTEYWVGVAIGWIVLIGVFAYVVFIVRQEKE
jgi:hypothetical protein